MDERPLLRTLWPTLLRGTGRVQFGLDPEHAVVVEGLTATQTEALRRLDGRSPLSDDLGGPDSHELMDLLREHRLVTRPDPGGGLGPHARALLADDATAAARGRAGAAGGYAAIARRSAAPMLVVGRGSLPIAITTLLRRAGGRVHCSPVGAAAPSEASPPGAGPEHQGEDEAPAVVVLTGTHALDPALGEPWRARGIPAVPVVLHATEAVIGPVVVRDGPCLRCLDHTRADLDPAWPLLLGQLVPPAVGAGPDVSGETTLVGLGAAMAAMVTLAVVDGVDLPVGRSLEATLPWPRVRQRQWHPHPRCPCGSRGASGRPADEATATQARMAG